MKKVQLRQKLAALGVKNTQGMTVAELRELYAEAKGRKGPNQNIAAGMQPGSSITGRPMPRPAKGK